MIGRSALNICSLYRPGIEGLVSGLSLTVTLSKVLRVFHLNAAWQLLTLTLRAAKKLLFLANVLSSLPPGDPRPRPLVMPSAGASQVSALSCYQVFTWEWSDWIDCLAPSLWPSSCEGVF